MKAMYGNDIRCYAEGKICFTEREAGIAINNARRHHYGNDDKRGKNIPKRKYFCTECGFYHLTHYKYFVADNKINYNERKFYAIWNL